MRLEQIEERAAAPLARVNLRAAFATWTAKFAENNILTYASAIALQLLVALAALVYLAVALLEPVGAERRWQTGVVPVLAGHLPTEWLAAILWSVQRETAARSDALIALGAAVLVWELSGAVRAVIGGLNRIYGVQETRSFRRRFLLSFGLAVFIAPPLIVALFIAGGAVHLGGPELDVPERILVPALLIYIVVAALVLVAPAKRQPWSWVSAGSVWIILAWLGVSAGYGYWVSEVVDLRSPDGALVVVLSLVGYLYATAIAFLVGAQIDQLVREGGAAAALGGRTT
jgi:membrane protein